MVTVNFEAKELRKMIESQWEKMLDEGKKWLEKAKSSELVEKLSELRDTLKDKMGTEFNRLYDALGLVTKEEFLELEKKVVRLTRKVNSLSKKSASSSE